MYTIMQIDNKHFLKLSQDLDKIKNTAMETRESKVFGLIDSLDPHFRKMQPKAREIHNLTDEYTKKFQALKSALSQKNFDHAQQDLVKLAAINENIKTKLNTHLKNFER
jgi:hypothetical protein